MVTSEVIVFLAVTNCFFLLLVLLNKRRDVRFGSIARQYNLTFTQSFPPNAEVSRKEHVVRTLYGVIANHEIVIQDTTRTFPDFLAPSLKCTSYRLLLPLFGMKGLRVHTKVLVDGKQQNIYPVHFNFLAPTKTINRFLAEIRT